MSSLRTRFAGSLLAITCCLAMALPHAATARDPVPRPATVLRTGQPDQLIHQFASCAGRLSAQMEHQWLIDGPASETTKAQRAAMIELLEAVMPPDGGRDVLNWRVEAKIAHAALLTRATFGQDETHSSRARALATRHIRQCTAILLS